MIVADTGGLIALLDRDDKHHTAVRTLFDEEGTWIVPWAIVPEVDYLAATRLGAAVAAAFLEDLHEGVFSLDGSVARDMPRAREIRKRYPRVNMGLVDSVVMAQAERHKASVIVTTDARHFRSVRLAISPPPRLVPLER